MEAKKQKISHYESLIRACDKTKAEYERILTKEASSKHFWKTASSDFTKSEVKILKLEYKKAKLRRKAKKMSIEISELRLKAWAKTHDVEDKIYELSETQSVDNQSDSNDSNKKSNKKAKKHPLAIVIVPAEIKKPKPVEVAAKVAAEPKKAVKAAKPKPVEAVAKVVAEPKKAVKVAKPKPVEVVAKVVAEPKKAVKVAKPKPVVTVAKVVAEPKKVGKVAKPKPVATAEKPQDLTLLEGIGAKVKEILANAGITTFAQLAAAKEADIKQILVENKFRFGNPPTMIEQAKLAAAGKMEELEALKLELKGGRRQ
jgi:predicted flap endonuclease-1-like 5' DNA nuclease